MSAVTLNPSATSAAEVAVIERTLGELPQGDARAALEKVLEALRQSRKTLIASEGDYLTPAQAAKLLGISRAHLYKILDSGALAYRVVGNRDRRIALKDLLAYQEKTETLRAAVAKQDANPDDVLAGAIDEF